MIESYEKAGKIVSQVRKDAIKIIKDDLPILDLVEFVENEIEKAGAGIAFPCNVSVNEMTAHYTSPFNDKTKISTGDLVKLDLGAHIDGYIADSAITVMVPGKDLEEKYDDDIINKNKEMIESSDAGLEAAINTVKPGVEIGKIGKAVQEAINSYGFNPVSNLTGHSLEQWNLHSGLSIPSVDDKSTTKLKEGDVIAIEPFATDGVGWVTDTPNTYIFRYLKDKPFRMAHTTKVLSEIKTNYNTLPFSIRWLTEKFNPNRLNSSMRQLSQAMAIYPYPALKEKTNCWVSQSEHTVIVEGDSCTITTK
ncbi:MAG: type II methionyl aminopeptidase [Methanobrevibacter arboriphilus]|uniref:Methionine aminopeptidase n=1 Tax=Methanobrevibacter arboriphilus TaxID=39441 RepID=A0A843AG19_METAZ|nr:type II methionyl aminopeptidase [Methanobrevibacter arboriphilus]MBF4469654.1 type II methionyl aminopeptidase [Methanobrevibacter arboriphilus]